MGDYNIDFARRASRPILDPDGWNYANKDEVRFNDEDGFYQFLAHIPEDRIKGEGAWSFVKPFFSNGRSGGIAYAGICQESVDANCPLVRHLTDVYTYDWLRVLCEEKGFEIVVGWDPFRPRDYPAEAVNLRIRPAEFRELIVNTSKGLFIRRRIALADRSKVEVLADVRDAFLWTIPFWRAATGLEGPRS